jgi:cytochrome bd-type quinol oxidase subunit 2
VKTSDIGNAIENNLFIMFKSIKNFFKPLIIGVLLLLILPGLFFDTKNALNEIIKNPYLLKFPIIAMVAATSIYLLIYSKNTPLSQRQKNIIKMVLWGLVLLIFILGLIIPFIPLIYFMIISLKYNFISFEEIFNPIFSHIVSPEFLSMAFLGLLIDLAFLVYFYKKFRKYYNEVRK